MDVCRARSRRCIIGGLALLLHSFSYLLTDVLTRFRAGCPCEATWSETKELVNTPVVSVAFSGSLGIKTMVVPGFLRRPLYFFDEIVYYHRTYSCLLTYWIGLPLKNAAAF